MIPRTGGPDVPYEVDNLSFWSMHLERTGLFDNIFDVGLAAGVKPSLVVHEARVGVHNKEYHTLGTGVMLSAGAVQLPALYMLAQ
jgi:hypothetical protein